MKLHVPARDGHGAIHKLIVAGMRAVSARNSARHSDWLGIYDSGCRTYSSHADPDEHHQSIQSSTSPTQRVSRFTSTNLVGHRNLDPRPSRQQHTDAHQLSVSSGEAEGRWYVVATDSFHPTQASLASFTVLTARKRRSPGTRCAVCPNSLRLSSTATRLPTSALQTSLHSYTRRALEIDANHPTRPPSAAYRSNLLPNPILARR